VPFVEAHAIGIIIVSLICVGGFAAYSFLHNHSSIGGDVSTALEITELTATGVRDVGASVQALQTSIESV
jgi:hypothetical protein